MRKQYLFFLVGLWTLLLVGLALWNMHALTWLSRGERALDGHEWAETFGYAIVWAVGVAVTMATYYRMRRHEKAEAQLATTLSANEERWRTALEAVGDGVWDWNAETNVVYFSPRWKVMLGFAEHEIDGQLEEWKSRVHPDDHARTMAEVQRHLSGETPAYECEHRVRCKDGSYKWILDRGQVVSRSPDGRPLRVIGTHQDLSAQKQAETARLESERSYRHLLASVTDYVFSVEVVDGRAHAATHGPGCLAVTGYTTADFASNPSLWFERVPAEQQTAVRTHWEAALRGELVESLEHQIRHKNGSIRWVRGTLVPRRDAQGKLVAFDGLIQDITTRKRMESDLRESEARYRLIADNTGDVIWLFDFAANRFSYVSPSVQKLSGYSVEEVLGLGLQNAVTAEVLPQARARLAARIAALAAGDESARTRAFDIPLPRKDGSVVETEVVTTLVTDASGRVTHLQGVTRDITVRKQAEAELRRVSHWLEHTQRISRVGGWSLNLATGRVWASPEARRIYGFDKGEFVHADIRDIPLPEHRPELDRAMNELVERGVPYDLEYRIRRPTDGAIIILHSVAERSADGTTVIGVIQDITERKQSETALRESEERFAKAFHESPVAMAIRDLATGCYIDVNDRCLTMTGYSREETIGRPPLEIGWMAEADHGENRQHMTAPEGVTDEEIRLRHKDGHTVIGSYTSRPLRIGGRPCLLSITQDITERKQAEEALRESEHMLRESQQVAALGSYVLDIPSGQWKSSAILDELLGINAEADHSVAGWAPLIVPADRAMMEKYFSSEVLGQRSRFNKEYRIIRQNDRVERWVHGLGKLEFDAENRPVKMVGTIQDITGRKQAELALRESEARYRKFIDLSPELVLVHVDGQIVFLNDAGAALMGADSPSALLGTPILNRIHADSRDFVTGRIRSILRDGIATSRAEQKWLRLDGRTVDVTVAATRLDYEGRTGVLVLAHDITARRQAAEEIARLARERQAILETIPVGLCLLKNRKVQWVNHAIADALGYDQEAMVGLDTSVLYASPETGRRVGEEGYPVIARGGVFEIEVEFARRDGTGVWGQMRGCALNPANLADGTIWAIADLTARRQAEAELRKLSRAVEQSPVTVVITDATGAIEYVNPSFTATTGYTFEEARGANPRILRSGELPAEVYREMWRTITAGREWRGEFHNRKKNGELFWEAATISPITDEAGRITHFLAVKEDITERKAAEARIREQAALLDVTQDAILVMTLDRVITFWNRGAEKLYGVSKEQAIGRRYETMVYRELPADYEASWSELVERSEWSGERRQIAVGRGEITVQLRASLVRDERSQGKSVLVVGTDITEAKQLEAQFLRAQRLESLGSLASGVAHDLNNVLTPILMSAGVLADSARTDQERELIQLLGDSARRGADIVQQLLLFGRGSDSPRSPMSVGAVLKDMSQIMRGTFPKSIAVAAQVPRDLWLIDGDRTQIHQVILNLCVNARDAMPAGGKLSVRAENVDVDAAFAERQPGAKPGPHVAIWVTDTGTGISPEHLEKIFDPFFSTKPTGQGTGLGLATVLGIVRSHGGFVTVESQVELGSEFGVYLPARVSAIESLVPGPGRPNLEGHGELVLVIDDEASIRASLGKVLTAHNYQVVLAGDGAEGVAVFVQNAKRIKLVITDVMMPVMDGTQAIRALRRLNPNLPVIAISGLQSQRVELEVNFGPRIRFLPKPFLIDRALHLARELLDEPPAPAES